MRRTFLKSINFISDLSLFTADLRFLHSGSMSLSDNSNLPDQVQSRNYLVKRLFFYIMEKYTFSLTCIRRDCLAKDILVHMCINVFSILYTIQLYVGSTHN